MPSASSALEDESSEAVKYRSALDVKLRQEQFLQRLNHRLIRLQGLQLLITGTMIVITIVSISIWFTRPTKNHYFLLDEQGRIVTDIIPISKPLLASQKVRSFTDDCVHAILDIDFVHYKRQLSNAERCFTRQGFIQLVSLMQDQGLLAELSSGYSVARVVPRQANFLRSSKKQSGSNAWVVKGAYLWSLQRGKTTTQYPLTIEATLLEVGMSESVYGIAINALSIQRG